MKNPYEDIIGLPRPVSDRHPRMPMSARAAQFSPFAALAGYDGAVRETARRTDERIELTGDEEALLNLRLRELADRASSHPPVTVTRFRPDQRKAGGEYVTVTGRLKKIDAQGDALVLLDGERIPIGDILSLQ